MTNDKDIRVPVILECMDCVRNSVNKVLKEISRYITQKNRHNTPNRLEIKITKGWTNLIPYLYLSFRNIRDFQ